MSFFKGFESASNGQFDGGGGDLPPIPAGTQVLAAPVEAGWIDDKQNEGEHCINLQWNVFQPAEYKNRRIFQKLRIETADPKKAEKAMRMLVAVDANAGGELMRAGEKPTSEALTKALVNKPMVLALEIWEIETAEGEIINGNWVRAVAPRRAGGGGSASKPADKPAAESKPADKPKPKPEPKPEAQPQQAPEFDSFDDDIPF